MPKIIDGKSGPFAMDSPGGYGRNAAYNLGIIEQSAIQILELGQPRVMDALKAATIRYTPEENKTFNDVFGYAEEHIKRFDTNQAGGFLDLEALKAIYQGDEILAEAFLSVLDRDKDMKIDTVDYAAFILFADDATNLIAETLLAFEQSDNESLFDQQAKQALREAALSLRENFPSAADGQITATESAVADIAIINFPTFTRLTLDAIIRKLDLEERYTQFMAL